MASLERHNSSYCFGRQSWLVGFVLFCFLVVVVFWMGKSLLLLLKTEHLSKSKCSSLQSNCREADLGAMVLSFTSLNKQYLVASWSPTWAWLSFQFLIINLTHIFFWLLSKCLLMLMKILLLASREFLSAFRGTWTKIIPDALRRKHVGGKDFPT